MIDQQSTWLVQSGDIRRQVKAADQHAAWNTLRHERPETFGLITTALREGDSEEERIAVHTAALMFAWDRDGEALLFEKLAANHGLGDNTAQDMAYALAHGRELRGPIE